MKGFDCDQKDKEEFKRRMTTIFSGADIEFYYFNSASGITTNQEQENLMYPLDMVVKVNDKYLAFELKGRRCDSNTYGTEGMDGNILEVSKLRAFTAHYTASGFLPYVYHSFVDDVAYIWNIRKMVKEEKLHPIQIYANRKTEEPSEKIMHYGYGMMNNDGTMIM